MLMHDMYNKRRGDTAVDEVTCKLERERKKESIESMS